MKRNGDDQSNKLKIEIEMNNGEVSDAVEALIFLANELNENGCIVISTPPDIQNHSRASFKIQWEFTEEFNEPEDFSMFDD